MGCFNHKGNFSNLPITYGDRIVVIVGVRPTKKTYAFIQYKRIFNECVEIFDFNENDYYGGIKYKSRYKLDVKKCYEMLLERNLIEE